MFELNEVLVPVDFSDASRSTFEWAQSVVTGEKPVIILLYVIDPGFVDVGAASSLGSQEGITAKLRARADREMQEMVSTVQGEIEVSQVVAEGVPFYEIVRHAEEFDVDAVIIGKGGPQDDRSALFFGSTAEKVVRACLRPVIVLPAP